MNRLITLMAAVMLTTLTVTAQNNEGKQRQRKFDKTEMIKRRTDRMAARFDLNQTQAKQLLELNKAYADKFPRMGRRAMMKEMGKKNAMQCGAKCKMGKTDCKCKENMAKRKSEMRANREAYEKELKRIMTDAQFSKYTEAKKQRMQRQRSGKMHHRAHQANR